MNMKIDLMNTLLEGIQSSNETKKTMGRDSFLSVLDLKIEENNVTELINDEESIDGNVAELLSKLLSSFSDEEKTSIENEPDMATLNEIMDICQQYDNNEIINLNNKIESIVKETLTEKEVQLIVSKLEEINCNEANIIEENFIQEKSVESISKEENLYKGLQLNSLNRLTIEDNKRQDNEKILDIEVQLLPEKNIEVVQKDELNIIDLLDEFNKGINSELTEGIELNTNKEVAFQFNNKNSSKNNLEDTMENQINILNNMNFTVENKETFNVEVVSQSIISQETIVEDVIQTVEYISTNNIEELTVKMNPKELGEITICLLKSESESKCIIKVKEEETLGLIKAGLDDIKEHLTTLDIPVAKIEVEMKSHNENDFSDNFNQQFSEEKKQQSRNEKSTEVKHENKESNESKVENNIDLLA